MLAPQSLARGQIKTLQDSLPYSHTATSKAAFPEGPGLHNVITSRRKPEGRTDKGDCPHAPGSGTKWCWPHKGLPAAHGGHCTLARRVKAGARLLPRLWAEETEAGPTTQASANLCCVRFFSL